jgi:2',3'-cyclic-nucleotide 2'-phosphodiesterase (5'-nucleotidase family)
LGQTDPRKKGVHLRPPLETAQALVKELEPKSDLILLLSHLGYPKDMDLAKTLSGIHIIAGSHTGMNLTYPPVVKSTVILQAGTKGMYAGRLDLALAGKDLLFYNIQTKRALENNLNNLTLRLNRPAVPETEKVQLRKTKMDVEQRLAQLQGKNEFQNLLLPLSDRVQDTPDIAKLIETHKSKFPEPGQAGPASHK